MTPLTRRPPLELRVALLVFKTGQFIFQGPAEVQRIGVGVGPPAVTSSTGLKKLGRFPEVESVMCK
jgi:hypothetical protein